jgi:hypothetical protein
MPETSCKGGATFQNATIAQIAVQLTTQDLKATVGIELLADAANSGTIYIGFNTNITSSTGFPLKAGDSINLPVRSANEIFVISDSGTNKIYCVVI